jgi:hypothetical protein
MEPFFEFCNAVIYAASQLRIEYRAWQAYRRNQSPREVEHGPASTGERRFIKRGFYERST